MSGLKIFPVILSGGSGTRLWPLSRKSYPKQFLNLSKESKNSLLQQTQDRLFDMRELDDPIVVCNEEHRFIVAENMREINVRPNSIILEKVAKNTCPAITLSTLKSLQLADDPIILVFPADHLIEDEASFLKSLKIAIEISLKGKIVTFGVLPTSPETGFGYIESKIELNFKTLQGIEIKKFIEKPSKNIAENLIKDRKYSWNSGIFVFKAKTMMDELEKFEPKIVKTCKKAIENSRKDLDFERLDEKALDDCPSISLDNAVMEKTNLGVVVPLDAKWSDVGSWNSLWDYGEKDFNGNVFSGNIVARDVKNSLFRSDSRLIVGMGVHNLIVVDTNDALLIADKDSAQNVKDLVEELKKNNYLEATQHKKVHRPWGFYFTIAGGDTWQVKKIEVSPGASLSLQMHYHRSEHWVVVNGTAKVEIDSNEMILSENESAYIPLGSKHRLSNPTKFPMTLIEVQSGKYLGEDDIHRFKDIYGR